MIFAVVGLLNIILSKVCLKSLSLCIASYIIVLSFQPYPPTYWIRGIHSWLCGPFVFNWWSSFRFGLLLMAFLFWATLGSYETYVRSSTGVSLWGKTSSFFLKKNIFDEIYFSWRLYYLWFTVLPPFQTSANCHRSGITPLVARCWWKMFPLNSWTKCLSFLNIK